MEAFLVSTGGVALGEMADKTQLLAMWLAAKFRKTLPIILGILVATLANDAMAGASPGPRCAALERSPVVLVVAGWMLIPGKVDEGDADAGARFGVFGTTVIVFF